jgi:hypothetical protein
MSDGAFALVVAVVTGLIYLFGVGVVARLAERRLGRQDAAAWGVLWPALPAIAALAVAIKLAGLVVAGGRMVADCRRRVRSPDPETPKAIARERRGGQP